MNRQQRRAHGKGGSSAPVPNMTLKGLLANAVRHHQAGQLPIAEAIYRQILDADPRHADALHLLGVLAHGAEHFQAAADLIGKAIAVDGARADFHYHRGNTFTALNRLAEAADCFRRATIIQPQHAAALENLGSVLTLLGQPEEGVTCFRKVVALQPNRADGHYNLGNALARQRRFGEAIRSLRASIAIRPDADACNTLGNALRDTGQVADAVAAYDDAVRLDPDNLALRSNRLLIENYLVDRAPDIMNRLALEFGAIASSRAGRPFDRWLPQPDLGPIRIGLVSGDLHHHPVG